MEELRRIATMPVFPYKGLLIEPLLYYKGNKDTVHSWDIAIRGVNLSKLMPDELRKYGLTTADLDHLNQRVRRYVDNLEGRVI